MREWVQAQDRTARLIQVGTSPSERLELSFKTERRRYPGLCHGLRVVDSYMSMFLCHLLGRDEMLAMQFESGGMGKASTDTWAPTGVKLRKYAAHRGIQSGPRQGQKQAELSSPAEVF